MGLTRAEQETVIRWDEDAKLVSIWSASPITWRKLARLGLRPKQETSQNGVLSGKSYALPFASFRWGVKGHRRGNPQAFRRSADPVNSGVRAAGESENNPADDRRA